MPGTMMPGFYNHNYHILQTPDHVVIRVEMIHDTRIVPIDGRGHLDEPIRQWLGDSRGHWEGDTLVVETTNLSDLEDWGATVYATGSDLRLVERFTRIDENTVDYQFTVHDDSTFSEPWTASLPMTALGRRAVRVRLPRGQLRHREHAARRARPGGRSSRRPLVFDKPVADPEDRLYLRSDGTQLRAEPPDVNVDRALPDVVVAGPDALDQSSPATGPGPGSRSARAGAETRGASARRAARRPPPPRGRSPATSLALS